MRRFGALAEFGTAVGQDLGSSDWHAIDQRMVDRFAETTGDRQWIHVDPGRAAAGPYGGTVVHGYHLLAMIPMLFDEVFEVDGVGLVLNKEVRGVRFLAPVRVGDRMRCRVALAAARQRPKQFWEATFRVTAEVESHQNTAFTAETVFLYQPSLGSSE